MSQENVLPLARQIALVWIPSALGSSRILEGAHIRGHVRILDAPAPRDVW